MWANFGKLSCVVCSGVVWCGVVWCVCVVVVLWRCGVSIQNVPVCTFKTSPCVPATRAHVETHVRVVLVHTEAF